MILEGRDKEIADEQVSAEALEGLVQQRTKVLQDEIDYLDAKNIKLQEIIDEKTLTIKQIREINAL